jgi:hypothetical protein
VRFINGKTDQNIKNGINNPGYNKYQTGLHRADAVNIGIKKQ